MDAQIDHAAGMPIGLLDELPLPVDSTESLFSTLQEPLALPTARGGLQHL